MAIVIPILKDVADANLNRFQSKINQTSPLNDKSFLRTLSVNEAAIAISLYKYGAERAQQNLVASATDKDLDRIGEDYGLPRKQATPTILTFTLPGTNGVTIFATNTFVGDFNGANYIPTADNIITGGVATIQAIAETPGESGNLNVTDTLTIAEQVAGAESVATVISVDQTGTEKETDVEYRVRIFDKQRSNGGGGNTADYREWAQETPGVVRAYPYTGRPIDDPLAGPPARTVYIEASTSIDPDGIAPASLLTDARSYITTDPVTGIARQPLGLTDDTLFVQSIQRTAIHVEIRNFDSDPVKELQIKSDIETALTNYFAQIEPFVDGLDPDFLRNDLITDLTVSAIVQDVLEAGSASATGVGFGLSIGSFLPSYFLDPGERTKLGTITYI